LQNLQKLIYVFLLKKKKKKQKAFLFFKKKHIKPLFFLKEKKKCFGLKKKLFFKLKKKLAFSVRFTLRFNKLVYTPWIFRSPQKYLLLLSWLKQRSAFFFKFRLKFFDSYKKKKNLLFFKKIFLSFIRKKNFFLFSTLLVSNLSLKIDFTYFLIFFIVKPVKIVYPFAFNVRHFLSLYLHMF